MVAERAPRDDQAPISQMYIGRMDTREEWIPANQLVIPDEYQRAYRPAWAKQIAKNFDMKLLTKISVNRRPNGTLVVIDGQHRLGALREKFGKEVDIRVACEVYRLSSIEDEALTFLALNHYIRQTDQKSTFKALLEGGDPSAVALNDLVNQYGYRLSYYSTWGDGQIPVTPLLAVRKQHDRLTWNTISELLSVIRDAYGNDTGDLQSRVIVGLGSFLATYRDHPDYRRERLLTVLRNEGQTVLARKSRDIQAALRTSDMGAGRKSVLALYNHKLSARRLPDV